jgi:CheY-like chemotaxis protein
MSEVTKRPRVLVVEDEMTIALLIEDMLTDIGCEVAALATRLPQALEIAETVEADLAILDLNLDGRMSFPVAEVLARRGVPFVFATGYGEAGLSEAFRDRPSSRSRSTSRCCRRRSARCWSRRPPLIRRTRAHGLTRR